MINFYEPLDLLSESDVEQKFVYKFLTNPEPAGLGYSDAHIHTKVNIRKITIDKGKKSALYYPDYAIIVNGIPAVIIEAKTPGESIGEAYRQARLYATEVNASYPQNLNPCQRIIVTDGINISAGHWDSNEILISVDSDQFNSINPEFANLIDFVSKKSITKLTQSLLKKIKKTAQYVKPVQMLGGSAIAKETLGENSFGSNISIEYKYLFNPDSISDREAIIQNAYVTSKRKQSHVAPIDKIVRAAIPEHILNARSLENTASPAILTDQLMDTSKIANEICLLIGSVGSGKSTFTDFLRLKALPKEVSSSTEWINLNLNKAPLTRGLIYDWVITNTIENIKRINKRIDFDDIKTLKLIYSKELRIVKKGKAALYPENSDKYIDIIFKEIDRLQDDKIATLNGIINYVYTQKRKLLVIVLDNCDKRNRDDQLLMFEVASWIKNTFCTMIFLPIRDTTYDQFREQPPLDTVIKDLVFRIDPPLLEKVIYKRLNYVVREIKSSNKEFKYYLPNNMSVTCNGDEVIKYLKSMISSLFQDPLFKRIITGIAGRNIRKGLEIILDFCKSGYIDESEILKVRQSSGNYRLPSHLISKILFKGKRKYYSDDESYIKNLFHSDAADDLPDPFVRISILNWLKVKSNEYGPNRTRGFHKVSALIKNLQAYGHSEVSIFSEITKLSQSSCITSESQSDDLDYEDLVSLSSAGFIQLDLLKNITYLSAVSEDTLFRENQPARLIADNLIGKGSFKADSKQTQISNSQTLIDYMIDYRAAYFIGAAKLLDGESLVKDYDFSNIKEYIDRTADNDDKYSNIQRLEKEYPSGFKTKAQIVSIQSYGFFVEFGLHATGLLHKSNFNTSDEFELFEEGDEINIEIIKFNHEHKKFDIKLAEE